jgi:hypothetical protein
MTTNLRKPSKDSNSDIQVRNTDRIYFVVLNEDGSVLCHCGEERDAIDMVQLGQGRYYRIGHYPDPPKVVNVSSTELEKDKQLNAQNILPERQAEPLNL